MIPEESFDILFIFGCGAVRRLRVPAIRFVVDRQLRMVLRSNRGVIRGQGRRLVISSPDNPPMQIDGDPARGLPRAITIRPAALKILLPGR